MIASAPKQDRAGLKVARATLRAQGMRPMVVWVPDTRAPGFAEEARRQSALAAASPHAAEDPAFVDAISVPLDKMP